MDYAWFLDNGWSFNDKDKRIIERWKESGRSGVPTVRTLNHIRWRLMCESNRFTSVESATADWFPEDPDPPDPVDSVSLSPLSIQPHSRFLYTSDNKIFDYRESTAMGIYRLWLDGEIDKIDGLFSYFKSRKINAIRPLFNLNSDYWRDMGRSNSHLEGDVFWGQLVPFIKYAESYGLYTRLCLFGGVEAFVGHELDWRRRPDVVSGNRSVIDKMHVYLDQFVGTTRDLPVLYEIANEPSHIGFGTDSEVILDLGQHCKSLAPDRLMNFGAATNEDSLFYCKNPADFFDEHLPRKGEYDYQISIKRLIEQPCTDQKQMPFISGEWMNLGSNGQTDSTATAFASTAMLRVKRAIPSFHAHCLLKCDVPDLTTDACLMAWNLGLDLIPIDFPGQGINGHWSVSPFDKSIFPPSEEETDSHQGPMRIYGLDGPAGYIGISIREPAGYDLRGDERPIETIHLERWGDWQTRIVKAGPR